MSIGFRVFLAKRYDFLDQFDFKPSDTVVFFAKFRKKATIYLIINYMSSPEKC